MGMRRGRTEDRLQAQPGRARLRRELRSKNVTDKKFSFQIVCFLPCTSFLLDCCIQTSEDESRFVRYIPGRVWLGSARTENSTCLGLGCGSAVECC